MWYQECAPAALPVASTAQEDDTPVPAALKETARLQLLAAKLKGRPSDDAGARVHNVSVCFLLVRTVVMDKVRTSSPGVENPLIFALLF